MQKKQLTILFIGLLAANTIGGGLTGLLPAYATGLGGGPSFVGYFISLRIASFMAGSIASGWIADRYQARKLVIITSGLGAVVSLCFLSWDASLLHLTLWACLLWFAGGAAINQFLILAGLSSTAGGRGKVFGLLAVPTGLGQFIGGALFGMVVSRWGYEGVFISAALVAVVMTWPGFVLHYPTVTAAPRPQGDARRPRLGAAILGIILAATFASAGVNGGRLGMWLDMDTWGLGGAPTASTIAIGGLVSMPIPILLGWLSDRMARRLLLVIGYAAAVIGLVALVPAVALWQFAVVTALLAISEGAKPLAMAMVTDLAGKDRLGLSLSLLNSASSVGSIMGTTAAGSAIAYLGVGGFIMIAPLVPLVAILLLIPMSQRARDPAPPRPAQAG